MIFYIKEEYYMKKIKKRVKVDEVIINVEDINDLIQKISKKFKIYAPVDKENRVIWGEIRNFSEISKDYIGGKQTTILPPTKQFFFPARETLLTFNKNQNNYEIIKDNNKEKFVIFGVHPCDIHGILLMDKVFLDGFVDDFYKNRRKNSIIIGMDTLPNEWNFAKYAKTDTVNSGFDLFLTPIENNKFYTIIGTGTGKKLLNLLKKQIKKPTKNDYKSVEKFKVLKNKSYKVRVDMNDLPKLLDRTFESKIWDEIGKQCVACTRCSIVCPTCYCHNVKEDFNLNLSAAERFRTWDSCLRNNFALVAGGHNFRPSLKARIRHRYYHKERIFSYTYGKPSCVGCGRCGRDCKAGIKPNEVYNKLRQMELSHE